VVIKCCGVRITLQFHCGTSAKRNYPENEGAVLPLGFQCWMPQAIKKRKKFPRADRWLGIKPYALILRRFAKLCCCIRQCLEPSPEFLFGTSHVAALAHSSAGYNHEVTAKKRPSG